MADEQPEIEVLTDVVVTKYKTAGDIANTVLQQVIKSCVVGAKILDVCRSGDELIVARTDKVYTKKVKVKKDDGKEDNKLLPKGVAFPTCISVNGLISSYSPLAADEPHKVLADRDVCKIELGVHIDGYIASVAHTVVVGATADAPVTGKLADTLKAAHTAGEVALRLLSIDTENSAITETVGKVCDEFGVKPVEGMLSHLQQRNKFKADKSIVQNPSEQQRNHERFKFADNMVVAFGALATSGDGKVKDTDLRTTVFQKSELTYQLRMKAARATFSEISRRFNLMPFSLRSLSDERLARMGILQCNTHGLVDAYKVQAIKEQDATVAHFRYTALVTSKGIIKLTGLPLEGEVVSDKKVEDKELVALLNQSVSRKSKANKKKAKAIKSKEEEKEKDEAKE